MSSLYTGEAENLVAVVCESGCLGSPSLVLKAQTITCSTDLQSMLEARRSWGLVIAKESNSSDGSGGVEDCAIECKGRQAKSKSLLVSRSPSSVLPSGWVFLSHKSLLGLPSMSASYLI